uniref:Uncharacterized protein n=1 Tax=Rhipicephalus zambeziensis TaxID=60191 RepID=A0A224YG49_9ACAR
MRKERLQLPRRLCSVTAERNSRICILAEQANGFGGKAASSVSGTYVVIRFFTASRCEIADAFTAASLMWQRSIARLCAGTLDKAVRNSDHLTE